MERNSRYDGVVKLLVCVLLSAGTLVLADEAADRAALDRTIARLSSVQRDASLFSPDFEGYSDLERLNIQLMSVPVRIVLTPAPAGHVIISKEVWGEATWDMGTGTVSLAVSPVSRFVIKSVRFVTSDVALVQAVCEQFAPSVTDGVTESDRATPVRSIPVLVILRRAGESFHVASFHFAA